MNIQIVTIYKDQDNFGQRLQNYALQECLKSLGHSVSTIVKKCHRYNPNSPFRRFDDKYMNLRIVDSEKDVKESDADCFVIGSDQVFSCRWSYGERDFFTLPHIPSYKKTCYAASAGEDFYSDLSIGGRREFFDKICTIGRLSFREKDTCESFKKHGVESKYHIDPVFLLSKEDWAKIEKKPESVDENEIFDIAYILTTNTSNIDVKNQLENAKKNGFKVYDVNSMGLAPDEFIWMFHHCRKTYVMSFHGVAFSVIFSKEYQIYDENDFRIKNLIDVLGIKIKDGMIQNYEEVIQNLKSEQEKSRIYFNTMLTGLNTQFNLYECCAYSKNPIERNESTSGGICARLAECVFQEHENSIVYGASYSQNFRSVNIIPVSNMLDYYKHISGSKYSFSKLPKFKNVQDRLDSGQFVMFTGLPCQIMALNKYLKKQYKNLLAVELLCSGVSSNERLTKLIDEIERENNSRVISFNMRYKHQSTSAYTLENGKNGVIPNLNSYEYFINSCRLDRCKKCNMHMRSGYADITLGDFWDNYNNDRIHDKNFSPLYGTNLVIINTDIGEKYFNNIKRSICFKYLRNI